MATDNLLENVTKYLETRLTLIKVDLQEDIAVALAKAVQLVLVVIVGLFVLIFASLGLGAYLNYALNSDFAGYLLVAGFYALLLIVAMLLKNTVKSAMEKTTENLFIKKEKVEAIIEDGQDVGYAPTSSSETLSA